jgi:hypothetical protein
MRPDQGLAHCDVTEEPAGPITQDCAVEVVVNEAGDAFYLFSGLF